MKKTKTIDINGRFTIGGNQQFSLLAGPCVIESESLVMHTAETLKKVCEQLNINLIFKSSFDKANRSSLNSKRGPGLEEGLRILQKVKRELDLPTVTDVHETTQCQPVAEVVDMLQIPAFLCRQTDLLLAAAATGKPVNVKKGQFMAPSDVKQIIGKFEGSGNDNILLCERGTSFGYHRLVVDFCGLPEMRAMGYPIVFDATHAVQQPGGEITRGNRDMVPYLINAACAIGIDALFAEVHPDPDHAWSDAANQLQLDTIEPILRKAIAIDNIAKNI
ncbi:MAG: 3-deoxy-8-phosphooctulonate synthase [Bacteroidales bacterium]|nr:3-deoxy-8-phosphooctulonate synthase [Bacteroidales bacterium]